MPLLETVIPGNPLPKERPREDSVRRRTYTPAKTANAEALIRAHLHKVGVRAARKCDGPVGVALTFYRADDRGADLDNLVKLVTDAMNGLVYADDSQIREMFARVHRKVGKAAARTEVFVYALED